MTRLQAMNQFRSEMDLLRIRVDRLSKSIVDKARKTAQDAGLSPEMPFLHAHNAMCSFKHGNPWPEVNYALARKVLWLEKKSCEPSRLFDVIWKKSYNRMLDSIAATDCRYEV